MTPNGQRPTVRIDPPPRTLQGTPGGTVFRVTVNGTPAHVERYAGASHVRFAFRGRVEVEVGVDGPIDEHRLLPVGAVDRAEAHGSRLRLVLRAPSSVVVRLGDREPLFLLPDPIAADAPPDGPGVVRVTPPRRGLATAALQAAIDWAAARPGGTVHLPAGHYRSGTLRLRSHTTLHVAAGAVLEGAGDPSAYPVDPGFTESATDASLEPDARFWGRTMTHSRLLLVDGATDVRIRGRGTIAGNGRHLRTVHGAVPNVIRVRDSSGISIEDVLLRDAAAWTLHVLASRDVSISNVKILNDRDVPNTDGIDPDMSSDVRIDRAFIWTADDGICVKATRNGGRAGDVHDVRVSDCVVSSRDAALKVGSESDAALFADIVFEDCTVLASGRAMSVVVRDGATCERVAFRRIHVDRDVDHLVEQVIGVRDPGAALGSIRDLSFEDVNAPAYRVPASGWTWYAQFRPGRPGPEEPVPVFAGADATHAVDGLRLRNVVVNGRRLTDVDRAREVAGLTVGPFVNGVDIA
jgi:polygalacturonase